MSPSDPVPRRSPADPSSAGWGLSVLLALIAGIVGFVTSSFAANSAIEWYQVPAYEGTGIFFVAPFALLGLLAGCLAGLIAGQLARRPGLPNAIAFLGSVAAVLTLVATTAFAAWVLADIPPEIGGEKLFLLVELRMPAGVPPPAAMSGARHVRLGATSGSRIRRQVAGPLFLEDARAEDGRWIVPGVVPVFTSGGGRAIEIGIGDAALPSVRLPLPGHPTNANDNWSEWLPQAGGDPGPHGFALRYRVVRQSDPVRVQSFGRFRVDTIVRSFYPPRGPQWAPAESNFRSSYDGRQIPGFDRSSFVALLSDARPVLLTNGTHGDFTGCFVVSDNGPSPDIRPVDGCRFPVVGRPLTSDPMRFASARDQGHVFGWVDRMTFRTPGLFLVDDNVVDTRTLTVSRFNAPDGFTPDGLPPPLGLSPDERSFVWFVHGGSIDSPRLGVTDWKANRSYTLAIDRDRMRFIGFETLDPGWVSHHFTWRRDAQGLDVLEPRTDFVPLPYRGHLTLGRRGDAQGYLLLPAGEPLRQEVVRMLVEELHGRRLSDQRDDTQRVRLDGKILNVRVGSELVSVTMAFGQGDPDVLSKVAAHLDAAVGSGKYDALFRAPAHFHAR
jgi:hypothetical protein